jgi:HK97 family phage prohead protease
MNGLEYKAFRLKASDLDEKTGEFEGYVAAFGNVDHDGDIIERGAFAKTIADNGGVFPGLWQHDVWSPIGASHTMAEDDYGLKIGGRLAMGVQRAREAFELLAMGALKGLSIGYLPVKIGPREPSDVRRLKEIRLFEWSTVTFPANELAVVTGMKASDVLGMARSLSTNGDIDRAKIESAIEALKALLDPEPSDDTRSKEAAASGEPSIAGTLRDYRFNIFPRRGE